MIKLIWVSIKMNLEEMWSYRLNTILELFTSFVWGVSIVFGLNVLRIRGENFYLAYIAWTFFHFTANRVGIEMNYFTTIGVIERIFSSYYPVKVLILSIVSLSSVMSFIYMTVFYFAGYFSNILKNFNYMTTFLIFCFLYIFMVGLSYLFAGLYLIFKRTMSIVQLINLLLFGIGTYAAGAKNSILMKLTTYTYAIYTLVNVHSGVHISGGDIEILAFTSLIMIIVGVIFFEFSYNFARKAGTIGHM